jgi:hypothetical protein
MQLAVGDVLGRSFGSSGSQMIAVWSPRVARWRSTQLAQTFSVPSSNHLIETLSGEAGVLHLGVGLDPVDALAVLAPERLGIGDRGRVHLVVLGGVDMRVCGELGRGGVMSLGIWCLSSRGVRRNGCTGWHILTLREVFPIHARRQAGDGRRGIDSDPGPSTRKSLKNSFKACKPDCKETTGGADGQSADRSRRVELTGNPHPGPAASGRA